VAAEDIDLQSPPSITTIKHHHHHHHYHLQPETVLGDFDRSCSSLRGGRVLLLLRLRGEVWELIGDCCVYDVMYGKVWNEGKSDDVTLV